MNTIRIETDGAADLGRVYLWPPQDRSKIDVVGMIEAPEVNITSRIPGRIKQLNLIEGEGFDGAPGKACHYRIVGMQRHH